MKNIYLDTNVEQLTNDYPELIDILVEAGFKEMKNPAMRHSMGKFMTLDRGAQIKGIDLEQLKETLKEHGFQIVESRQQLLQSYLERLNQGEDLESVRADFVENFKNVDASEIMEAEQFLLNNGTPLEDVQQLCDIHSALFHGNTTNIVEQEKAMMATRLPGHPLHTFVEENAKFGELLLDIQKSQDFTRLDELGDIKIHYAKKGDLLYPNLKVKYGVSGPNDVMWTVDDELRDELTQLIKDPSDTQKVNAWIERAAEMVYKENEILYPLCMEHFTQEEWEQIYLDSQDYDDVFGVHETWDIENKKGNVEVSDKEIIMPGGHLNVHQLTAMLNAIPGEISFVDEDNINRYFNEGEKVFKRPSMAIDREVFSCHPPKIEMMVRAIIDDFRSGKRDDVKVWMEKQGKPFLVNYIAVRDSNKNYVGTMEFVLDMSEAKSHFVEA